MGAVIAYLENFCYGVSLFIENRDKSYIMRIN